MPEFFIMNLDTPTLFTSITIACFSGACILTLFSAVSSSQPAKVRQSGLIWAVGLLLIGAGCTLVGLRGQISDSLSIVAANGILLLGHSLRPVALRMFSSSSRTPVWPGFAASAAWLALCFVPLFRDTLAARTLFIQSVLFGNCLYVCWLCLTRNPQKLTSARILAGVSLLEASAYLTFVSLSFVYPQESFQAAFQTTATSIYLIVMITCVVLSSAMFATMMVERTQKDFQLQATQDPLTGLRNRRAFLADAEAWRQRREAGGTDYSLLYFDLDNLSSINERFGRALGDAMLKLLAKICGDNAEKPAIAGRIGSEEFALFLPGKNTEAANALAMRISRQLTLEAARASGDRLKVTVSTGIFNGTSATSLERAFEIAIRCMSEAKATGKNRRVASTGTSTSGGLETTPVVTPFSLNQRSLA